MKSPHIRKTEKVAGCSSTTGSSTDQRWIVEGRSKRTVNLSQSQSYTELKEAREREERRGMYQNETRMGGGGTFHAQPRHLRVKRITLVSLFE
jgi:hypothetical protein